MPPPIEWILCDLGKTLIDFDHMKVAKHVIEFAVANRRRFRSVPGPLDLYNFMYGTPAGAHDSRNHLIDRGDMTLDDLVQQFDEHFGLGVTVDEFRPIWSDIFTHVHEDTLAAMHRAKAKGIRLALCSSTNPAHWEWVATHYPRLAEPWERLFLSYEMRLLKTDPEFFPAIARATGAAPQAHLFLDDLDANLESARRAGIQAIKFAGRLPAHEAWA